MTFNTLSLQKLHFEENIMDLAKFLGKEMTKIKSLTLNDCDIGNTSLKKMLQDCKNLKELEELKLISMNISKHVDEILVDLHNHKHLKVLDLSNNDIENM